MYAEAEYEGAIPEGGVGDVLGGLEEIGTSGVLAFQSTSGSGTIELVHGQISGKGVSPDD